jgi:predicted pPIWI-associating nuclease
MSEEPIENNSDDLEKPERIIDEIDSMLGDLKARFVEGAIHFGQEQERIQIVRPEWEKLSSADVIDPDQAQIYASGVHALAAYRDELRDYKNTVYPYIGDMLQYSPSTGGTVSVTSSTTTIISTTVVDLTSYILEPSIEENKEIQNKLRNIDPALEKTYLAIREILYGTASDPERAALYLIRQTFDHFFAALAPDDAVRSSTFFKPKADKNKNAVVRHERLMYAAHTHIGNNSRRKALIASFRHMLDVYEGLNRAHTRGNMNLEQARVALREMLVLLQEWIRAIDLPPFA